MPPLFLLFAATQAQVPVSTPPRVPSMAVGNEENREQLELARRQGAAYVALVDWERRGAAWSGTTDAADYRLAATITPAEGEWVRGDGTSHWQAAPAGQVHLRLFPQDRGSGRFVPGLQIRARFIDAAGTVLGEVPLPFALYPATDAYGANVPLPPGTARLAVVIEPMRMMRHDPYNGDRFFERTTAILPIALPGPVAGASASERAEATPPAALLATRRRALEDTIKTMWAQASSGGEQQAGGIIVTYAIEYAEAFWRFSPSGKFRYTIENEALNAENAHLEIAPRDPRTGRYVPAARVTTETIGPGGGNPRQDTPQLWHSWLYHFGKNVRVPRSGKYRLDVTVTPTPVAHYERQTGDAWWDPVSVSFADAEIKTGGSDAPDRFRCNRAARTRRRACAGRAARFPAHLHLRHAARRLGRGDAVDDRRGRQRVAVRQFRCGHDPQRADRAQHRAGIWRHRPALARRLPRFRGRARTAAAPYRGQAGGALPLRQSPGPVRQPGALRRILYSAQRRGRAGVGGARHSRQGPERLSPRRQSAAGVRDERPRRGRQAAAGPGSRRLLPSQRRVPARLEYHSDFGRAGEWKNQYHYVEPTVDVALGRQLTWHLGAGVGFAGDRDGFIVQSILTFEFNVIRPSRLFGRKG